MTTTAPTTFTINADEARLLDAARGLAEFQQYSPNGHPWTVADYVSSTSCPAAFARFDNALNALRTAEDPCQACAGTCEDEEHDACKACDGRGWVIDARAKK